MLILGLLSIVDTSGFYCLSPPTAGDGVLSAGERHAAPEGPAGTSDETDPSQHPAAAGRAETYTGPAAESPGAGHPGRVYTHTHTHT